MATYLLTVGHGGPHTSHVSVRLRGNVIGCAIGASAARNILREPNVTLFWPPNEPGGYAMIVNGVASSTRGANGATMAEIESSRNRSFIVGVRSRPTAMDLARPTVSQLPGLNSGRWISYTSNPYVRFGGISDSRRL